VFQAEDGIRAFHVTGVQTCALPISAENPNWRETDLLFPSYNGLPLEPGNLYRAKARIIEKKELPPATLHELRAVYATYVTRELEIGRASWRERAEIAVGGVEFKKLQ